MNEATQELVEELQQMMKPPPPDYFHPDGSSNATREYAALERERETIGYKVKSEAEWQIPNVTRAVAAAVTGVATTALGGVLVRVATNNAPAVLASTALAVGAIVAVYGAKVVARTLGNVYAGVMVGNFVVGVGLLVLAILKDNQRE